MWFNVDDNLASSPYVLAIPKRFRLSAMGLWVTGGSWLCAHLNNDLFVPDAAWYESLCGTPTLVGWLVDTGFIRRAPGGNAYTLQGCRVLTPEQLRKQRESNAERTRRSRESKGKPSDQQVRDDVTVLPTAKGPPLHPVTPYTDIRTDTDSLVVGFSTELTTAHDDSGPPPPICLSHPSGTNTACRNCESVRKHREARDAEVAAALKKVATDCPWCDGKWVLGNDGQQLDPMQLCSHVPLDQPDGVDPPGDSTTGQNARTRRARTATERQAQ